MTRNNLFLGLALFLTTLPVLSNTADARYSYSDYEKQHRTQERTPANETPQVQVASLLRYAQEKEKRALAQAMAESLKTQSNGAAPQTRTPANEKAQVASLLRHAQNQADRDLAQAIAESLKTQSNGAAPQTRPNSSHMLSKIEARRTAQGQIIGQFTHKNKYFNILSTSGENNRCGLNALGMTLDDAETLMNSFMKNNQRDPNSQQSASSVRQGLSELRLHRQGLHPDIVCWIGKHLLGKNISVVDRRGSPLYDILKTDDDTKEITYVVYEPGSEIEKGHFSRVVSR